MITFWQKTENILLTLHNKGWFAINGMRVFVCQKENGI